MTVKTLIIDPNHKDGVRLQHLINGINEDFTVFSIEVKANEALKNIIYHKPDVIFLETELDVNTGFELIEELAKNKIQPIAIFTTYHPQYAVKALKHGAFDYLLKPIDMDELKITLKRIYDKLSPKANKKALLPKILLEKLSTREQQIVKLLFDGKTSKQIADQLKISKATVNTHRRNILDKTGFKSTSEMICHY